MKGKTMSGTSEEFWAVTWKYLDFPMEKICTTEKHLDEVVCRIETHMANGDVKSYRIRKIRSSVLSDKVIDAAKAIK